MAEQREEYEIRHSHDGPHDFETATEDQEVEQIVASAAHQQLPWEPENDAIRYIIEKWGMIDDRIVVKGRISEISVTWEMARGDYQSDKTKGTMKLVPDNLKCDVVIDKAEAEIVESGGDIGIVGQVVRRLSRELDLQVQGLMKDHFEVHYAVPPKKRAKGGEKKRTVL